MVHYSCFDVTVSDAVATVVLRRGDALNTMVAAFFDELPRLVCELSDSGRVRALVLASTGRHFSAGLDLSVLASLGGGEAEPGRRHATLRLLVQQLQAAFTALEAARFPVIAAVHGGCIGGAVDLVCAADIRYATDDAFFCVQEINLGITADLGTLQRLPKLVPEGIARELAYTGRRMPAAQAREVGLVNAVFDSHEAMLDAAGATAHEIAAKSPLAVWGSKLALTYARDHSVADALDQIATWQAGMFQQVDVAESLTARAERRSPAYDDLPPAPRDLLPGS